MFKVDMQYSLCVLCKITIDLRLSLPIVLVLQLQLNVFIYSIYNCDGYKNSLSPLCLKKPVYSPAKALPFIQPLSKWLTALEHANEQAKKV